MNSKPLNLLFALLLIFICFIPVLRSSLTSDDIRNFQVANAHADKSEVNLYALTTEGIQNEMRNGRFLPVSVLLLKWVFIQFDTVQAYKCFQYVVAFWAVVSFLFYLNALGTGINLAVFSIFYISCVQFRADYHDPSMALNGMYPLLAVAIFTSLGAYAWFIRRQSYGAYAVSLLMYTIAHLSSEIGLVVFPLLILSALILKVHWLQFVKGFWPFALITCSYMAYTLYLRSQMGAYAYPGLVANYDIKAMADVILHQVYGALPLSSLHKQKAISVIVFHQLQGIINLICVLLIAAIGVAIYRYSIRTNKARVNYKLLLLALAIIFIPAILLSPSVKYQYGIPWGIAYLPVFIQNFGVALFIAMLYHWLKQQRLALLRTFSVLLLAGGVVAAAAVFCFSSAVIDKSAYERGEPAEAMMAAVKQGLLSPCHDGATILLSNDYIWREPQLYAQMFKTITEKDFNVQDSDLWLPDSSGINKKPCYLLHCPPGSPIVTSLYKIDCTTGKQEALLKQYITPSQRNLIEEEHAIYYPL